MNQERTLKPLEADYKWVARVYKSIAATDVGDKLLWRRLGAKTIELIHEHLSGLTVDNRGLQKRGSGRRCFRSAATTRPAT